MNRLFHSVVLILMSSFAAVTLCATATLAQVSVADPAMQRASLPHTSYHPNYQTKYHTIAHEILDDEAAVAQVTPSMYTLIDNVIDESRAELPARSAAEYAALSHDDALAVLTTIDRVLYRHGFVYPAFDMGWVDLLSDGLTPRTFNLRERDAVKDFGPYNSRRRSAIDRIGTGPFYLVDCDTASFLYLAVADVLRIPVLMVNLPDHDFIQWDLGGGRHLNFETMYGEEQSDDDYSGHGQTVESVAAGLFMKPWTREQTLGYHAAIVASKWSGMSDYVRERDIGLYAIALYPTLPDGWNAIAWSALMSDDANLRKDPATLEAAKRAVLGFRYANNLDTLACAYAEASKWKLALSTEQEATHAFNSFPDATDFSKYLSDFTPPNQKTCYYARSRAVKSSNIKGPAVTIPSRVPQ
jgi:hypothetical protein